MQPDIVHVSAVHSSSGHTFSKESVTSIELITGRGVAGDAHFGAKVQHRSRVAMDPTQPNLRQVHLLHDELLEELHAQGYPVGPGQLGENVTTHGLDLLGLSRGARLRLGTRVIVEVTGLRNPCAQIEAFRPGLLAAVLGRAADGSVLRKTGVMGIVLADGTVRPGDPISIVHEPGQHVSLQPV